MDSESGQEQVNNQVPIDDNSGLQGQPDVTPIALEEIFKGGQHGQPDIPRAALKEFPNELRK